MEKNVAEFTNIEQANKRIRSISHTTLLQLVLHMLPEIDCEWNAQVKTSVARQIRNL